LVSAALNVSETQKKDKIDESIPHSLTRCAKLQYILALYYVCHNFKCAIKMQNIFDVVINKRKGSFTSTMADNLFESLGLK
jgi:hypothetical protein